MKPLATRALALALTVVLAAGSLPAGAAREDKPPKGATLEGKVLEADGSPAADLTVVLTPLEAKSNAPLTGTTDRKGSYRIRPVPYGLYQIGFVRGGNGYPANRVVLVQPGRTTEANFELGSVEPRDQAAGIAAGAQVAGLSVPAAGVARMEEHLAPRGLAWLRTGRGVAVVVGVSALLVAGVMVLADDDEEPTPAIEDPDAGSN